MIPNSLVIGGCDQILKDIKYRGRKLERRKREKRKKCMSEKNGV